MSMKVSEIRDLLSKVRGELRLGAPTLKIKAAEELFTAYLPNKELLLARATADVAGLTAAGDLDLESGRPLSTLVRFHASGDVVTGLEIRAAMPAWEIKTSFLDWSVNYLKDIGCTKLYILLSAMPEGRVAALPRIGVAADLPFKEKNIHLTAKLRRSDRGGFDDAYTLSADLGGLPLANLAKELEPFLFNTTIDIPKGVPLRDLKLNHVSLGINGGMRTPVMGVSLGVTIAEAWTPFKPFTLERVSASVAVILPLYAPSAHVSLSAALRLGVGLPHFNAGIELPSLEMHAELLEPLKLDELIGSLAPRLPVPKGLAIERAVAGFNPKTNAYGFAIDVGARWPIVDTIYLDEVSFEIEGEGARIPSGSIRGVFKLGAVRILLDATYKDTAWRFRGSNAGEGSVPIGDVAVGMLERFNIQVPDAFREIKLKWVALDLTLGNSEKRFDFNCIGMFPLAGFQAQIEGTIKLAHTNGKFHSELGGRLTLNAAKGGPRMEFGLTFKQSHKATTFEAKWEQAEALYLDGIVRALGFEVPVLPEVLRPGLKSVGFTYDFKVGKLDLGVGLATGTIFFQTSLVEKVRAYVLGCNAKGPVGIKELPFIGAYLSEQNLVTLDSIRLVLSNCVMKDFVLPGGEKVKLERGFSLQGKATIGSASKDFNVVLWDPFAPKAFTAGAIEVHEVEGDDALAIEAAKAGDGAVRWIELQRNVGPFQAQRIGFQMGGEKMGVLLDGGIASSGVLVRLYGLSVRFDPRNPGDLSKWSLGLEGIQVGLQRGPLTLRAGLLVTKDANGLRLTGEAVVMVNEIGFAGLGDFYQGSKSPPSLFVWVYVGIPFGDPSFMVKGLALGFGVNRAVVVPPIDKLEDFALLKVASGGSNGNEAADLRKMNEDFPVKHGNIWFAAGVKFTTYEMLSAFVLPVISFGVGVEIALLATGGFQLPGKLDPKPISIQMVMYGGIKITDNGGAVRLEGTLTKDSYILVKEGRIEGGFALCTWFPVNSSGEHRGDFLFTLGGYHPDFEVPPHYPKLEALGINCSFGDHVSLKGTRYLAVTNSCLMIGGRIELVVEYASLRVWFKAHADAFVAWAPFSVRLHILVTVGIAVKIELFGISKTVSAIFEAELKLVQPALKGTFRVRLLVLDMTFDFGNEKEAPSVDWKSFKETFLGMGTKTEGADVPGTEPVPFELQVSEGLRRQVKDDKTGEVLTWVVDPSDADIRVLSKVPIKSAAVNGVVPAVPGGRPWETNFGVGIVKVKVDAFKSDLVVEVSRDGNPIRAPKSEVVLGNLPRSLWWPDAPTAEQRGGERALLKDLAQGVRIFGDLLRDADALTPIARNLRKNSSSCKGDIKLPRHKPEPVPGNGRERIEATIASDAIHKRRVAVLENLRTAGFGVAKDVRVTQLARGGELIDDPTLETLKEAG